MSTNLLPVVVLLYLCFLSNILSQDSNHYFCGTTWDDASSNCPDRQHCPTGTDDECVTEGHICFGGTTCDVNLGDGSAFKYANLPYDDISNTRFCGIGWNEAAEGCSVETHCPSGNSEECPEGMSCYGSLGCNVKDMLAAQDQSKSGNSSQSDIIGKDDPRRNQFCGSTWADASKICSQWCPDADDSSCPNGQTCFGDTTCYHDKDFSPTITPTVLKTDAPVTIAPVPYNDPGNTRFCGVSWTEAVAACSIESHCPSGLNDDCPEGQSCHGGTPCNFLDFIETMKTPEIPTFRPTMPPRDDPSNTQFCGVTWASAEENCSLATHCPDRKCPGGLFCHGGVKCNAYDMTKSPVFSPTLAPSSSPSSEPTDPTQSPTGSPPTTEAPVTHSPTESAKPTVEIIPEDDLRHSYWCGKDWADVTKNCLLPCPSGQDTECPNQLICFAFTDCRPSTKPTSVSNKTATEAVTVGLTETPSGSATIPPSFTGSMAPSTPHNSTPSITNHTEYPDDAQEPSNLNSSVATSNPTSLQVTSSLIWLEDLTTIPTVMVRTTRPTSQKTLTPSQITLVRTEAPSIIRKTLSPVSAPSYAPLMTTSPSVITRSMNPVLGPSQLPVMNTDAPSVTLLAVSTESTQMPTKYPLVDVASETVQPSLQPSSFVTLDETLHPTSLSQVIVPDIEVNSEAPSLSMNSSSFSIPSQTLITKVELVLSAAKNDIVKNVLLTVDTQSQTELPTKLYNYDGFLIALSIFNKGLMGSSYFYLGDDNISGYNYGLVNVALLLAHAAIETVKFDICDEISWEKDVFGYYPLSNACGQGRLASLSAVPYEDSNPCKDDHEMMACQIDPDMKTAAITNEAWSGAPPPLECYPKSSTQQGTAAWNPFLDCDDACNSYEDQVKGNIDPSSIPASNSFGRTDVEGCCWWGRGAFPRGSAGTCRVGKLNYFLGSKAGEEGRLMRYELDFCKDPEAICRGNFDDEIKNAEVRWLMGMQYWIEDVQSYNKSGWSFIASIRSYFDGGFEDQSTFDAISSIVTRGCHNCGNPISNDERLAKFQEIMSIFTSVQSITSETLSPTNSGSTLLPSLVPSNRPSSPPSLRENIYKTTTPVVTALSITKSPELNSSYIKTSFPTEIFTLRPNEMLSQLNSTSSYCASSEEDARRNCATTIKSCNEGDPPCPIGTACFGNIACSTLESSFQVEDFASPSESSNSSAIAPNTLSCGQSCLRPLLQSECHHTVNSTATFPDCLSIIIGEVCEHKGECGPEAFVRNCDGRSVFIRSLSEQCAPTDFLIDFVSPSVIPSSYLSESPMPSLDKFHGLSSSPSKIHSKGQDLDETHNGVSWWRNAPQESCSNWMDPFFSVTFILISCVLHAGIISFTTCLRCNA